MRKLVFIALLLCSLPAWATTWFVRPDGGDRYSAYLPTAPCDGQSDLPAAGAVNHHCAYNDERWLYLDGNYNNGVNQGWSFGGVVGGDTIILRGSIGQGFSYRVGFSEQGNGKDTVRGTLYGKDVWMGVPGNAAGSFMPAPPSGTAAQHTRILGENYANCHAQSQRTQLHGGWGVAGVIDLSGTSYVDVQCLDITDFSTCGHDGHAQACDSTQDWAQVGFIMTRTTNHLTVQDVRFHGLADSGLSGPASDGSDFTYVDVFGNGHGGWDADNHQGSDSNGTGSILIQNFNISWNGCVEEYPIIDANPYIDCTDQNNNGVGDGFGSASVANTVAWNIVFDQGIVSYNTQDGLDALHLYGAGTNIIISRTLAFGNMGQQLKVGGSNGAFLDDLIVENCFAMHSAIPGTPVGFNSRLTFFCRAFDGAVLEVSDGYTSRIWNTTIIGSPTNDLVLTACGDGGTCTAGTALIDVRNSIFLGFVDSVENGHYVGAFIGGPSGNYPPRFDPGNSGNPFINAGSVLDHNITWHVKPGPSCPDTTLNETNAICADPGLTSGAWPLFGYNDMTVASSSSAAYHAGVTIPGLLYDYAGTPFATPRSIGALEYGSVLVPYDGGVIPTILRVIRGAIVRGVKWF